jgi:hypothetical protein
LSIVDRILGRAAAPASSAGVRAELTKAEEAAETARTDLEEAKRAYAGSLLAVDPAETARARQAVTDAEVAVDRAEALTVALRARFEAECEVEAEEDRRQAYDAAAAAQAKATRRLERDYPRLAREIVDLLSDLARAELKVLDANEDLPAGAAPIQSPEATIRFGAPLPAQALDERVESEWHYAPGQTLDGPVEHYLVREIKPRHPGARIGSLERRYDRGGATREFIVVKRRRRVQTFLPALPAGPVDPLAVGVRLPGLDYGEPDYWRGAGASHVVSADPAFGAADVLAHAEALAAERANGVRDLRQRFQGLNNTLLPEAELLEEAARFAAERAAQ